MEKPTVDGQKPKARISWGTGIAMLYIGFVLGMLFLVTLSMNQRVDLVSEDYYAQELDFQNKINKNNRAKALSTPLRWEMTDTALEIEYPTEFRYQDLAGKVRFYCPSDNEKDIEFAIMPNADNQQTIPLSKIQPGRYLLQFDWKNGETTYWNEGAVVVTIDEL